MNKTAIARVTRMEATPVARTLLRVAGVVGFALLTAAAARIVIPLPGTPVPITAQTLVVLLAGMTLGARLGAVSMAFYLLLGATGYHVFSLQESGALGAWGLGYLAGPTGGYLLGFVLAQPLIGRLTRVDVVGRGRRWLRLLGAVLGGHAIIFAVGLARLAVWLNADLLVTLEKGLLPFLPGLVVKSALALGIGGALCRHARRHLGSE